MVANPIGGCRCDDARGKRQGRSDGRAPRVSDAPRLRSAAVSTVVVSGATGLIGGAVVAELTARGDTVVALARDPDSAARTLVPGLRTVAWPDPAVPPPAAALSGADAVV